MGSPCEPLTPRQELIAGLEGFGYDLFEGVATDWRDSMSDAELRNTITQMQAAEIDPPDISELVEAIRETVVAADAHGAATRDQIEETGKRWRAALTALRTILSDCDRATKAFNK